MTWLALWCIYRSLWLWQCTCLLLHLQLLHLLCHWPLQSYVLLLY